MRVRSAAWPLFLGLLVAGCAAGPDYVRPDAAALRLPAGWSVPAPQGTATDLTAWWTGFGDPQLAALVERARTGNLDIAQATARLRQARESLIQSRAALLPEVGLSAGYSRFVPIVGANRITLPDGTVTEIRRASNDNFSVGGNLNYQVGLFGEVRRTVEATRAAEAAAGFDRAAVLVSIQGEVARNYVLARLYQAQLANARESLRLQDDNLEIAGFRVQAGLVSSLDAEQARAQRANTAATIPSIEANHVAAVGRLGVLIGEAPGTLRPELERVAPIPRGPADFAVGIPADVIRQRPDVQAAERNLAAATAQIGVAEAALYPALSIGGSISSDAQRFEGLTELVTGRLFAGLVQAVFDGGRRRSVVRASEAAAEAAFAAYRGTVLVSLEEVENALAGVASADRRRQDFTVALDAADAAAILARSQYRAGLTDFVTLNSTETTLLNARQGLVNAEGDRAAALIQLYLALGGGWSAADIMIEDQ